MSSLNQVQLIGNLGADPEVRNLPSGGKVVNLSIATSERWKDKNTGEQREKTEWHRVVIFSEPIGKVAETYLKKGSKVYLQGALQTRKWQDQAGQDKYSTEIVLQGFNCQLKMLDGKPTGDGGQQQNSGSGNSSGSSSGRPGMDRQQSNSAATFDPGGMDDDIPF